MIVIQIDSVSVTVSHNDNDNHNHNDTDWVSDTGSDSDKLTIISNIMMMMR